VSGTLVPEKNPKKVVAPPSPLGPYELQRKNNIAANNNVLDSLGVGNAAEALRLAQEPKALEAQAKAAKAAAARVHVLIAL